VEKLRPVYCVALTLAVAITSFPSSAAAQVPQGDPTDLPVLSLQTPRGGGRTIDVGDRAPTVKTIDGDINDWVGEPSRYGGTALISAGEYIYQDHLFDAHGPDDGRDARRLEQTDTLETIIPQAYRLDALAQADPAGELGVPVPDEFHYDDTYGDATSHQDSADLHELRLAVSGETLNILARTTTMKTDAETALLLLADTKAGAATYEVPFGSGLSTSVADLAFFIADGRVLRADLASGEITRPAGMAAVDSNGWTNAIEASLSAADVVRSDGTVAIAAATGLLGEGDAFAPLDIEMANDRPHPNLANVAFRFHEPVRVWFEKEQALALHEKTIDPFFTSVQTSDLVEGASQRYAPGPGYHDRIFVSDPSTGVPREGGRDGVLQHYGVYLPKSYDGSPVPLQWWLHWRGGNAHTAGGVVPKVFKQFGEDRDAIVVSPSGRGTSTWYVGRGHVDFRQVWSDVTASYAIDRDRVYVTGHSMGGWGSYLLTLLYPDRFAAAAPVAGPVTQGAWTGVDFEGCDDFAFEEYTPCYIGANDSRPRDQHTRKLLENARHVPYAILHGTSDELVPYSGVFRQAERLTELGYRHRLYTYPGYEHYSHPIADQWAEAASYLHSFERPVDPARVTYKRDMPFERATEEVQSGGATLEFDFDSAYWMSDLTPIDMHEGTASFDGRSLALADPAFIAAPDSAAPTAPGQTGPYVVTGVRWVNDPTARTTETANGFDVDLAGASAVTLDLDRMSVDTARPIEGSVSTEAALDLGLAGEWAALPDVSIDGRPTTASLSDGVVHVTVPAGDHVVTLEPREPEPEQEATTLTLSKSGKGAHVTLSATLTESDSGAPVAGRTIEFFADGASVGTADTNHAGVASISFKRGSKRETYSATFSGDREYAPSSTAS
jgi:poly(3-hydroxybutyrate) depolymerase